MRNEIRALEMNSTVFSRPHWAILAAALLVVTILMVATTGTAQAAGVVGDGTPGSCDGNAVADALTTSGTVTFNCGTAPHTIIADTYFIPAGISLVIDGNSKITLDGENLRQIFLVGNGAEVTLQNIVLTRGGEFNGGLVHVYTNGVAFIYKSVLENTNVGFKYGGAIFNEGLLDIEQSILRDNTAQITGGAIHNVGTLTVRNSVFYSNKAFDPGAGYGDGGAIYNLGPLTIERTTLGYNRAERYGGALALKGNAAEITNSTIHENYADRGAGIYADAATGVEVVNATIDRNNADYGANVWNSGVPFTILNTIIADGSTEADDGTPSLDCDGPALTSQGGNIISDGSCITTSLPTDQRNTDPKLTYLWPNGGFTDTVRPAPNSPAIDKALDAGCPTIDQRGVARPQGSHCDVGAFEVGITDTDNHLYLPTVKK